MRLRSTALPCFLVTVKPTRGFVPGSLRSRTSIRMNGPFRFSPLRTAKNCGRLFSRPAVFFAAFNAICPLLVIGHPGQSSRKALATALAAGSQNQTAAFGSHTRPETMAALANKLGGLKGTLRHLFYTAVCGPSWVCSVQGASRSGHHHPAGGTSVRTCAAYSLQMTEMSIPAVNIVWLPHPAFAAHRRKGCFQHMPRIILPEIALKSLNWPFCKFLRTKIPEAPLSPAGVFLLFLHCQTSSKTSSSRSVGQFQDHGCSKKS